MSEPTEPQAKRGRPPTGTARTAAERMAATRQRGRQALNETDGKPDLSALADTSLFEAMRVAYRKPHLWDMAHVVEELFARANRRSLFGHTLTPSFTAIVAEIDTAIVADHPTQPDTATVATMDTATVAIIDTATVADNQDTATVAETDTATVADNAEPFTLATAATVAPVSKAARKAARDAVRNAEILARYAAGEKKRPIASQMGISDGTVRNVLARHGITEPKPKKAKTNDD